MARPTIYTPKLAFQICKRIAKGQSLRGICRNKNFPDASTIHLWLLDGKHEEFFKQYAHARQVQAEMMFEELLEIADDGSNDFMTLKKGDFEYEVENKEVTNRSRLRVDTRKWYLSKVLPKKFGEKIDVTSGGKTLPAPILGGITVKKNEISPDNSVEENISSPEAN